MTSGSVIRARLGDSCEVLSLRTVTCDGKKIRGNSNRGYKLYGDCIVGKYHVIVLRLRTSQLSPRRPRITDPEVLHYVTNDKKIT